MGTNTSTRLLPLLWALAWLPAAGAFSSVPPPPSSSSLSPPVVVSKPHHPICILQLAYDGTRYSGWANGEEAAEDAAEEKSRRKGKMSLPRKLRRQGKRPQQRLPTVAWTLGKALSIIHSHAPLAQLDLQAAVSTSPGVSARGGQLAWYRPPEGAPPFGGDFGRAAHSLNGMLPEELRVLKVAPAPWADPDGDGSPVACESARFVYTVALGPSTDPTLRHHCWVYTPPPPSREEQGDAAVAQRVECLLKERIARCHGVVNVRVRPARGPGVAAAAARLLRVAVAVANPAAALDQPALVAWIGGGVRAAFGDESDEGEGAESGPPLAGLVLEEVGFRIPGGTGDSELWTVRDPLLPPPSM